MANRSTSYLASNPVRITIDDGVHRWGASVERSDFDDDDSFAARVGALVERTILHATGATQVLRPITKEEIAK